MILLHDLDGVHVAWQRGFARSAREHQPNIDFEDLDEPAEWDMTAGKSPEAIKTIHHVLELPGFYRNLDPIPGGLEVLNKLQELGHENFFVSSPYLSNPTCASDKYAWLEEYYGRSWAKRLILTNDKTLVDGDVLFDDKPIITGARTPTWRQVLFTQSYNIKYTNGRERINSWDLDEVLPILEIKTNSPWSDLAWDFSGGSNV